jgi:uncharacterized membrane protein YhaH (DUF805 family)
MDQQQAQTQAMHIMATILPIIFLIGLAVTAFFIFLFWRILTKAGMSGPLSLLILIPGIGYIIVLCILAFSQWSVIPVPAYPGLQPYPPPPPPPPSYPPPPPPQF